VPAFISRQLPFPTPAQFSDAVWLGHPPSNCIWLGEANALDHRNPQLHQEVLLQKLCENLHLMALTGVEEILCSSQYRLEYPLYTEDASDACWFWGRVGWGFCVGLSIRAPVELYNLPLLYYGSAILPVGRRIACSKHDRWTQFDFTRPRVDLPSIWESFGHWRIYCHPKTWGLGILGITYKPFPVGAVSDLVTQLVLKQRELKKISSRRRVKEVVTCVCCYWVSAAVGPLLVVCYLRLQPPVSHPASSIAPSKMMMRQPQLKELRKAYRKVPWDIVIFSEDNPMAASTLASCDVTRLSSLLGDRYCHRICNREALNGNAYILRVTFLVP